MKNSKGDMNRVTSVFDHQDVSQLLSPVADRENQDRPFKMQRETKGGISNLERDYGHLMAEIENDWAKFDSAEDLPKQQLKIPQRK